MKKNRLYKNLFAVILAVSCAVGVTACGNKKEEGDSVTSDNGSNISGPAAGYAVETQPIEVSGMGTVKVNGDTMYFAAGDWKEETEEYKQEICRLKIGETKPEALPITFEPNVYVSSLQLDADGSLLILFGKTEGEGADLTYNYFLNRYTTDGTALMDYDVTGFGKDVESLYIQYMAEDGQGNIYLADSENDIWILDHEGVQKGKVTNDNWINAMFIMPNGNVAVACLDNNGKAVLKEIDPETKKFGKTYSNLPDVYNHFAIGRENTILIAGNNKVYEYDILEETSSELLNWIDCDIDGNYICDISMLEDGRILAVLIDWSKEEQTTELVYLTEKQASEVLEKETITLGSIYLSEDVKQQVLSFNQSNEKYRVEVKEYGDGDWETGMTLLNAEIVAGGGPDLIDLSSFSTNEIDMYISKGILEDLNPYIDVDAELRREDYVEQALNAYQRDGKLYCLVSAFTLYTVIGKTSDVGSEPGWGIDDVMALMDSKPEGTELFAYCTSSMALRYCCTTALGNFVDMETGECNFNDGYFEKVLEFAGRFLKEANWNEGDESVPTKIQNGTLLLLDATIRDISSYQMFSQLYVEPITFIGFPVQEGSGSYISPSMELGINTKAKGKDGAWEFLRSFLTEDYQYDGVKFGFPILRSALDAQFEEAMTPEYREENGEQVEVEKTSWGYDDWSTDIFAATKEQVDAVKALIEIAEGVTSYNSEINGIIEEEAAAFFNGQKSTKEVADIIQSRVQVYVNENR